MRFDDDDPKKPQPVQLPKKRFHPPEAAEAGPRLPAWTEFDRDHHRHI